MTGCRMGEPWAPLTEGNYRIRSSSQKRRQMGDMWFTRNDGHAWVLAPIAGGSQTVGWIDP